MIAVPRVRAQTFMQKMLSGRTEPSLFTCRADDGQYQDYVVKPYSKLGSGIICEFFAALVGRHLGLPIPPIRELLAQDEGPHFGSLHKTGGFAPLPIGFSISAILIPRALDIFAFDMLIQNPDRSNEPGRGKPNLLCNGHEFVIFDHELAFSFLADIDPSPQPWELRGLPFVRHHIFCVQLMRYADSHDLSFEIFLSRVMELSDSILSEMVSAMPENWRNPTNSSKIVSHLRTARDNIERFDRGLREALA